MRILSVVALLLACAARPAAAQHERAAEELAAWLELIDAGRAAESHAAASAAMRGALSLAAWEGALRQARAPFAGATLSRVLESATPLPQPPGAPAGEYVRLVFATRFAGGREGAETVVAMREEDGRWRAAGYFIAPRAAAAPDYSAPAGAPYTAEAVEVRTADGHVLAGTLTLPRNASGRVPALVLATGSGAQDRDMATPLIPGYRPFRQVADTLGRRGIAVLRLDDRGVGGSGGATPEVTTATFADDVAAAVAWLRTRGEIDPARIAVGGISEGGIIAPLVATADPAVAAVVLMAAPSRSGREISDLQVRAELLRRGHAEAELDSLLALNDAERARMAAGVPWLRFFLEHDPLPVARRLRAPVLVLHGATDRQVPAEQATELAEAIRAAGNPEVTLVVFPGLNHLFVPDPDGTADPARYAALPSLAVPSEVLRTLVDWLVARLVAD